MTSIFKSNKFFRIIKHFILTIPLMVVLGTSIYTIVNPNAKDSYYGETINEVENVSIPYNKLIRDYTYTFSSNNLEYFTSGTTNNSFYISSITYSNSSVIMDNAESVSYFNLWYMSSNNGQPSLRIFDVNNTALATFNLSNMFLEFDFVFVREVINNTNGDILNHFYQKVYNDYSYLDNAFAYGMYQFNQVGFNKFDFVGLFDGIFTDNIHNVYTDFINSYINYYLMIECVYFVPWVIHIFIHFAYDLGDYFTSSFKRNRKEDD